MEYKSFICKIYMQYKDGTLMFKTTVEKVKVISLPNFKMN